jgi:phytoene/squalene synthetase
VTHVTDAAAAIVARDDPRLHATALFAPEPGRSRLMALYAYDVELDRAAAASSEPLIARMRLQWWRDVARAVLAGAEPPAHEVACPFARLVRRPGLPAILVEAQIAAREAELEGGFDAEAFARWADGRFGALTALAAHLLTDGDAASVALARRAGPVLGAAFALRHAGTAPPPDRLLLPGLAPEDRAALARGETTADGREVVAKVAAEAGDALRRLRRERGLADPRAVPALLPLTGAGRVLARASRPGAALRDLDDRGGAFGGLRLAWAAATGRW